MMLLMFTESSAVLWLCDEQHEAICTVVFFSSTLQQTCAVCLEEFRSRDELGVCPCTHAFHKK